MRTEVVEEAVCSTISVCSQSDGRVAPHPVTHTHFCLADQLSQGMELEVREKVEVKWALIVPANRTVCVCVRMQQCVCVYEKGCGGLTS